MKRMLFKATVSTIASLMFLGGCGGGDDDLSGGLTQFSVQPTEVTFTTPAIAGAVNQTCSPGGSHRFYVFGGAPPYRILNSSPAAISVDKALVDNEGGDFNVTVVGAGCFDIGVMIEDSLRRTVSVSVAAELGS